MEERGSTNPSIPFVRSTAGAELEVAKSGEKELCYTRQPEFAQRVHRIGTVAEIAESRMQK